MRTLLLLGLLAVGPSAWAGIKAPWSGYEPRPLAYRVVYYEGRARGDREAMHRAVEAVIAHAGRRPIRLDPCSFKHESFEPMQVTPDGVPLTPPQDLLTVQVEVKSECDASGLCTAAFGTAGVQLVPYDDGVSWAQGRPSLELQSVTELGEATAKLVGWVDAVRDAKRLVDRKRTRELDEDERQELRDVRKRLSDLTEYLVTR